MEESDEKGGIVKPENQDRSQRQHHHGNLWGRMPRSPGHKAGNTSQSMSVLHTRHAAKFERSWRNDLARVGKLHVMRLEESHLVIENLRSCAERGIVLYSMALEGLYRSMEHWWKLSHVGILLC